LALVLAGGWNALATDGVHAGPLFDEHDLTLTLGHRTEAAGPLYYEQQAGEQHIWALPPFISMTRDPGLELKEFDMLYPVLTYDRYGDQYRWQLFQVLAWAGGPTQNTEERRFTLFPFYFQQRSSNTNDNYTAVFPFYGHLKHRLFRDEIFFVMFPIYGETHKHDVVNYNYLYPFFNVRHGDGMKGWQAWPFYGQEHKAITTRTNRFGDTETVPGHDSKFVMWPFYLNDRMGLGTTNPMHQVASLPLFSKQRSPGRDSTTVLWPFFSHITEREKQYQEWDLPWPLIVFAHGEGKTTHRVFPFYSQAHNPKQESDFYMWPIYKYNRARSAPLDRERRRICFFLYSDAVDHNTETGKYRRWRYLWPLFTTHRDFNGDTRLQVLTPLEPLVPGSHKIERDWSPVWALWRSERSAKTGATSQSLLWNLYRHEQAPDHRLTSCFFGLYQSQKDASGKQLRVFYIPFGKQHGAAPARPASTTEQAAVAN
jgi:hypothetical protein